MRKKTVTVGGSLREAAQRVVDTWHRAERGERVQPQDNITFLSWSALASVMTDRRHELLRHLHAHPERSIRGLARALQRDFKRVHEDLTTLAAIGLVEERDGVWRADYDEIHASVMLTSKDDAAAGVPK